MQLWEVACRMGAGIRRNVKFVKQDGPRNFAAVAIAGRKLRKLTPLRRLMTDPQYRPTIIHLKGGTPVRLYYIAKFFELLKGIV